MKSANRTKVLLLLLVVGVVALAGHFAWPHLQAFSSQARDIRAQTVQISARADAADRVRAQQARYDAQTAAFIAAIPATPGLNDVIDELQKLSDQAHVAWLSGVPTPATAVAGGAAAWTVSMSLSGFPAGVSTLLDSLRAQPRLFTVDSASLSSSDGAHVTASVLVRVYSTETETTP